MNHLDALACSSETGTFEHCHNLCLEEAIKRMHPRGEKNSAGQIINIHLPPLQIPLTGPQTSFAPYPSLAEVRRISAALRRQAYELGIQVTLIEPAERLDSAPGDASSVLQADDVARCVYDSLIQPFGMDLIFLHGQVQSPLL